MTTEEAIQKIESIKSLFDYESQKAIRKKEASIKEILDQWLAEHRRFDVGDFVLCNENIVRIEDVDVEMDSPSGKIQLRYVGMKFELREDTLRSCGARQVFYDEKSVIRFNPLLRKRKQILVKIKN